MRDKGGAMCAPPGNRATWALRVNIFLIQVLLWFGLEHSRAEEVQREVRFAMLESKST